MSRSIDEYRHVIRYSMNCHVCRRRKQMDLISDSSSLLSSSVKNHYFLPPLDFAPVLSPPLFPTSESQSPLEQITNRFSSSSLTLRRHRRRRTFLLLSSFSPEKIILKCCWIQAVFLPIEFHLNNYPPYPSEPFIEEIAIQKIYLSCHLLFPFQTILIQLLSSLKSVRGLSSKEKL